MDLRTSKQRFMSQKLIFYCVSICFFSICTIVSISSTKSPCLDVITSPSVRKLGFHSQKLENATANGRGAEPLVSPGKSGLSNRRYLSGPGSSPPRCTSKCGKCTPCKPVHVPVPPGTPVTTEYYPEAWRCKCGSKLYMP
uniref:Epidermal patterning factor-like protein n=1 Tax=Nelumbo nucifera TaxID=4432 RepID=A0A822Y2N9_NELNU|nr:TPA_asm: hypothetical protein HUJ06_027289 [Nelumbo nucifera]